MFFTDSRILTRIQKNPTNFPQKESYHLHKQTKKSQRSNFHSLSSVLQSFIVKIKFFFFTAHLALLIFPYFQKFHSFFIPLMLTANRFTYFMYAFQTSSARKDVLLLQANKIMNDIWVRQRFVFRWTLELYVNLWIPRERKVILSPFFCSLWWRGHLDVNRKMLQNYYLLFKLEQLEVKTSTKT